MLTFSRLLRFSCDPAFITPLGITLMLILMGFIYYYFYSMASSSNSNEPEIMVSTSTSSIQSSFKYDVFISFRGEDTRNEFVSHLYEALQQRGIYTFKDDEKMKQGKTIDNQLIQAIKDSRFFIIVFSKNYASSSWCLDELAEIMECQKSGEQTAYPIFLDVEPTHVRKQSGAFGKAFLENRKKDTAGKWIEALKGASNLVGRELQATANGNEAEFIKKIVGVISLELRSNSFGFDENLVGMESRVKAVKSLLGKGDDGLMIGIYGMGGIGKTTIAKAVYNQIKNEFDGSSFVNNVRENGSDNEGLKKLQEKLLSAILMQENYKVNDCDDGKRQIQRRLGLIKVLVVVDDVDDVDQLEFLAGDCEWLHRGNRGSRIIVTTRNKHLLSYAQEKYSPELLNQTEALRLFCRHAFRTNIPPNDFMELSCDVVSSAGNLPLALKVLGSHFYDRDLDFWRSSLKVLTKPRKINVILKISYDGLDKQEKKMFLYISCFFKGDEMVHVTRILDSLGFNAVCGIYILIEKSLLTNVDGKLHMHDLIQEMGRHIVKECHPDTMLWVPKEVEEVEELEEVMMTNTRRETVEAIEHEHYRTMTCHDVDVFTSMQKLRLLILRRGFTSSEPTCFPKLLRWLRWSQYPFESLTLTSLGKLVGFEMPFSGMKQLQIEKNVSNIKFMDLRHSSKITSFPDVTAVPNLESLILLDCERLVEVHQSVLLHDRIKHLDLSYCCKLKLLPPFIQMRSLETLLLNSCSLLERFPEVTRKMSMLLLLDMDDCDSIQALPTSIQLLTGLIFLKMNHHGAATISPQKNFLFQGSAHLRCLRILGFKNQYVVEDNYLTRNTHNAWPSLEELDLSCNMLTRLPASISQLSRLKYLDVSQSNLEELCELPKLIQVLKANFCSRLQKTGDLSNKYKSLFKISFFCNPSLTDQETQSHLDNLFMKSLVQKCAVMNHRLSIVVRRTQLPNWFTNQQSGNDVRLKLPHNQINKMRGLTVCSLFLARRGKQDNFRIKFKWSGEENLIIGPSGADSIGITYVWIGYMSIDILRNLCHGSESEYLIITFEYDGIILECGACVIYEDDINPSTEIGSRITDYEELRTIERDNASSESLRQGRWSAPTFSFGNEKTGDQNTVKAVF